MSRSLYFVGGLAAMLLVVFAATVTVPQPQTSRATTAAAAPATDPASGAIDDLAAWPAAAGR